MKRNHEFIGELLMFCFINQAPARVLFYALKQHKGVHIDEKGKLDGQEEKAEPTEPHGEEEKPQSDWKANSRKWEARTKENAKAKDQYRLFFWA